MACTTILVGKKASYDGSTMIARNDDGHYDVKKLVVVDPKKQPKKYKSVISHVEVELPDEALSYTCCPNVDEKDGTRADVYAGGMTVEGQTVPLQVFVCYSKSTIPDVIIVDVFNSPTLIELSRLVKAGH